MGRGTVLLVLFLLLSATARSQAPPPRFADQRAAAAQAALQDHFRRMVDGYLAQDAGYEFAAHRSLGDPALLYGFLAAPDGADHPFEVFVVDGVWSRRQWVPRTVIGTPAYSDWETADASQFCDGNPDGSRGWEAETATNGTVRLMNDFVIMRSLFDTPQTCWHEANHAALLRGGDVTVPAGGGDGDPHHSYIIRYAERGVQVMNQLRQLEDAMAAVPAATRTPAEDQQAWGPVYVRWRKFLEDWRDVEPLTAAQRQEYRARTGLFLPEPAELAKAYLAGRYRGSRGVKPPAWVFAEGGERVTFLYTDGPVAEGPWGDAWRVAFDVFSPQGRTSRGRPDRGVLTVTLDDGDFGVTASGGALRLADGVSSWTYDLAADGADEKVYLLVLAAEELKGQELHLVFRYGGYRDPAAPDKSYSASEARVTVTPRSLATLKVTGPAKVGPDDPLLLRVEALDEKGRPVPPDPEVKFRWTVFTRYDYEGPQVDLPPRSARRYDVAVAAFREAGGKERQVAEGRYALDVVAAAPTGDPKAQAEAKHRWLQEVLRWLDELEQVDREAIRQLERRCAENHARQILAKHGDQLRGMTKEGAANALAESVLEEQARLHCMERPTEEHHQHRADLRATRQAIEDSRLAGDALKEYAGFGDYAGYLAAVEGLKARFKLRVPEPIPHPAALPWSYSLACSSDAGGVARLLDVKLTAPRTRIKPGEVLVLTAEATGGTPGYTYGWSADPAASGQTFSFASRRAGPHDLTVTVTDQGGKTGSATLRIVVSDLAARVTLSGPKAVPVGATARLEAAVLEDGKDAAGTFTFRWQPDPEVTFTPQDSGDRAVTATFPRPGRVDVWVQVLQDGRTVAESEVVSVDVVAPGARLTFEPAQPRVGQQARARLELTPDTPAVDVRWLPLPAHAVLVAEEERDLVFYATEAKPVDVRALARTPFHGDDLGEAAATVTVLPYDVTVTGPTATGPRPRVWKEGVGLVESPDKLAVGQTLAFGATVAPAPEKPPIRYRWTAPEGCTLSNPAAASPTVVGSRTGTFDVAVEVRDSRDVVLGRGGARFTVALEGMDGGRQSVAGEARKLLGEGRLEEAARKAAESGDASTIAAVGAAMKKAGWDEHLDRKPEEAVRHLEIAVKLLPKDADAAKKLASARKALGDRSRIEPLVAQARELLEARKLERGRLLLLQAEGLENQTAGAQSPTLKAGWDRFHARNAEYQADVARWETRNGETFRELDWEGMLAACQELRVWELLPATERSVAGSEGMARARLAEQQGAWAECERVRTEFEAGKLPNPPAAAPAVRNRAELFGSKDPRRQACRDLAARLEAARPTATATPVPPAGTAQAKRLFDQARQKYDRGDLGGAMADVEKGLELAPDQPAGWVLKGMTQGRMADYEGAIASYGRALQLDPKLTVAWVNRGNAEALAGQFEHAEEDYTAALVLEPGLAAALVNRGRLREALGNLAGAAEDYRRALQSNPKDARTRQDLARVEKALKGAAPPTTTPPPPATPPKTTPPTPPPPPASRRAVTAVFENRSGENVHLLPQGQAFGPENRVTPGARRQVQVALPDNGRIVFVAGRNGKVLATRTWDGDPDHLDRYPHVVWDGQRLTVTTGLR